MQTSSRPLRVVHFVNVPRTAVLALQVYHAASTARLRPRGWVDRPSEGILATYGLTYQAPAQALHQKDSTLAARASALADSVFRNTSYGVLVPAEN